MQVWTWWYIVFLGAWGSAGWSCAGGEFCVSPAWLWADGTGTGSHTTFSEAPQHPGRSEWPAARFCCISVPRTSTAVWSGERKVFPVMPPAVWRTAVILSLFSSPQFEEQQAFERSRRFLRQLEISFGDNPSHYQKIIKALQTSPDLNPTGIDEVLHLC